MKKILIILFLLAGYFANAQTEQFIGSNVNTVVVRNDFRVDSAFILPDTLASAPNGSFGKKNGTLFFKWSNVWGVAMGGGSGVTSVFGRTGAVVGELGDYSAFYPSLAGSYANPSWITSFPWSKITGTPTTRAGYGITDAAALSHTHLSSQITDLTTAVRNMFSQGTNITYNPLTGVIAATLSGGVVGNADSLDGEDSPFYLDRTNHNGTQLSSTISDFTSAVHTLGDARYPQLSGTYNNPSWLNQLAWSKITGAPSFLTSETDPTVDAIIKAMPITADATTNKYYYWNNGSIGRKQISYSDLSGTPDLSGYELLTNKAIDFTTLNNTKYPTTQAVADYFEDNNQRFGEGDNLFTDNRYVNAKGHRFKLDSATNIYIYDFDGEFVVSNNSTFSGQYNYLQIDQSSTSLSSYAVGSDAVFFTGIDAGKAYGDFNAATGATKTLRWQLWGDSTRLRFSLSGTPYDLIKSFNRKLTLNGDSLFITSLPTGSSSDNILLRTAGGQIKEIASSSFASTGDLSGYVLKTTTVNGQALSSNINLDLQDVTDVDSVTTHQIIAPSFTNATGKFLLTELAGIGALYLSNTSAPDIIRPQAASLGGAFRLPNTGNVGDTISTLFDIRAAVAGLGSGGYTNLTQFVAQNNWKLFYSNGSGDVQELALGASGTVLQSNGATSAPSFATPTTYTASGGLTMSGNDIRLGGTTLSGGHNIYSTSTSNVVRFYDNTASGMSSSNVALTVGRFVSSGTPTTGFGGHIKFEGSNASLINKDMGSVGIIYNDATNNTEQTQFQVYLYNAGSSSRKLYLSGTGQLNLSAYTTSTAFTGTPVGTLQVDASGNVIVNSTTSLSGGGGSGTVSSGSTGDMPYYTGATTVGPMTGAAWNNTDAVFTLTGNGSQSPNVHFFDSGNDVLHIGWNNANGASEINANGWPLEISGDVKFLTVNTDNTATSVYAEDASGNLVLRTVASLGGGSITAANPTAAVGLTATNGVASTYMRSDAAPALSTVITNKAAFQLTTATDANITAVAGTAYHLPATTLSANRTIDVSGLNTNGDYVEFYNNEEGFTWSFTGATVYDSDGATAVTELLLNTNSVIRRVNGKLMISKL